MYAFNMQIPLQDKMKKTLLWGETPVQCNELSLKHPYNYLEI